MHRLRILIVVSTALLGALVLAACGGDDGGGEDPQTVLDETFNNDEKLTSGVFDLSVNVDTEGGSDAGSFEGSLGGPFQSAEGEFPKFDIEGEVNADTESQDVSGSAGLVSTGDKAFLSFQDTDYEVPAELFSQFSQQFVQAQQQTEQEGGSGNFLSKIGVDPTDWLTDLENEGNEDVEGTETIHISGTADTPKLVEDAKKIAENAPEAAGDQITPEQLGDLDELPDLIERADFDIYTGADDDLLRKLEANLALNPPDEEDAPESVDVTFTLTLSALNDPQEIAAPSNTQPLGDLLEQFGVDPSQLGATAGSGSGGSASGGALPQAGGSPEDIGADSAQAYLECLQTAGPEEAVQECASLLE